MMDKRTEQCLYCSKSIEYRTTVTSLLRFMAHAFREHPDELHAEAMPPEEPDEAHTRLAKRLSLGLAGIGLLGAVLAWTRYDNWLAVAICLYFASGGVWQFLIHHFTEPQALDADQIDGAS